MKIFLFAPVLRFGSYNKKLIRIAHEIVGNLPGLDSTLHEFNDFPMPIYDGDLEVNHGIPEGVLRLAQEVNSADALIISSPEYNGGIPGPFKNAIDWLSRLSPVPLEGKQICLLGASQGYFAGMRGNLHSRVPLQVLKAHVYPDYFGIAFAQNAFDEKDQLKDPREKARLQKLLINFIHYASRKETSFDRLDEFLAEQNPPHARP